MKRFEFSLERLLKLKRQQERLAELEQQRARLAVDAAKARVDELQTQLARLSHNLHAFVGQAMTPQHWVSNYDLSTQLGSAIMEAEQAVATAEQAYWEKAEARAHMATEVEALQTLRKKQWDQFRQECSQAEQIQLDEIGLRSWQRHTQTIDDTTRDVP